MDNEIVINVFSKFPHLDQILTGFFMLDKKKALKVKVRKNFKKKLPLMEVLYKGLKICYDVADEGGGYKVLKPR